MALNARLQMKVSAADATTATLVPTHGLPAGLPGGMTQLVATFAATPAGLTVNTVVVVTIASQNG